MAIPSSPHFLTRGFFRRAFPEYCWVLGSWSPSPLTPSLGVSSFTLPSWVFRVLLFPLGVFFLGFLSFVTDSPLPLGLLPRLQTLGFSPWGPREVSLPLSFLSLFPPLPGSRSFPPLLGFWVLVFLFLSLGLVFRLFCPFPSPLIVQTFTSFSKFPSVTRVSSFFPQRELRSRVAPFSPLELVPGGFPLFANSFSFLSLLRSWVSPLFFSFFFVLSLMRSRVASLVFFPCDLSSVLGSPPIILEQCASFPLVGERAFFCVG